MKNRWIIVFLLTLTLGGAWLWISRVPVDATVAVREPEPAVGHPAPDFALGDAGRPGFCAQRDHRAIGNKCIGRDTGSAQLLGHLVRALPA